MEPVTHFLSGAILSRAGFNRKTAYATLAMTLAAEMPDLDVLWYVRGPVAGFEHHRGITHTFLGAPFEALIVTAVMWGIHRLRKTSAPIAPKWPLIWLFSCCAILLHILLDYTNNYGVRPFYPFSPRWYAWSTVFIVDPFLLFVFVMALVVPALFALADREMTKRRTLFRGQGWAVAALILAGSYYGLRSVEQAQAIQLVRVNHVGAIADDSSEQPIERLAAEPYPFSPFHWHAIVETPDYFQTADVQTLGDLVTTSDKNDRIAKPEVTPAVAAAKQSWLGRVYLGWAQFPITRDSGRELPPDAEGDASLPQTLTRVDFEDLRFAYSAVPGSNEGSAPLSASVYVAPNGQIEAMYMGENAQK
jgi:inner membrane protein